MLSYSLLGLGRMEEALAEAGRDSHEVFRLHALSMTLWAMGRRDESEQRLQELIDHWADVGAAQIAELYAFRGDADATFSWIDRAIEQRDGGIMEAAGIPLYAVFHSDPRWAAVRKRLNYAD